MKRSLVWVIAMFAVAGIAQAKDLCSANPYTKKEAELGKVAFESRCALCHQCSMAGTEFSAYVSSAANTFPAKEMKMPDTYFHIAAYVLYRNCGKM